MYASGEPVSTLYKPRRLPELQNNKVRPLAPLSDAWQRLRLFEALARAVVGHNRRTLLLMECL